MLDRRERDAADGAVDSWIEALVAWDAPTESKTQRQEIHYAIDVRERFYVPAFALAAFVIPMAKNSAIGVAQSYELSNLATSNVKNASPIDRTIGRLVNASGMLSGLSGLSPVVLGTMLEVMIGTGRLHWR
ncbi:MAG: hypothetical protein M3R51_08615, partial [Candidatus Eremiobacteraeota bacterium]|nr:hypothetical protein [Candidatus Eremiobacteraeota bacterium]